MNGKISFGYSDVILNHVINQVGVAIEDNKI